jgi:hypothetical protein
LSSERTSSGALDDDGMDSGAVGAVSCSGLFSLSSFLPTMLFFYFYV